MMIWVKISVKFEFMRDITLQIETQHILVTEIVVAVLVYAVGFHLDGSRFESFRRHYIFPKII